MPRRTKAIAALAAIAMLAGARPTAPLAGTYRGDCAPYDRPAFRITLAVPHRQNLELTANVSLAQMAGEWVHSGASRPGTATILLCREVPERICSYPEAGRFTVSGRSGGVITGNYDAQFKDAARLSGQFRARPAREPERRLCG